MKLWLCRHRRGVILAYIAIVTTAILVLQILEAQGVLDR